MALRRPTFPFLLLTLGVVLFLLHFYGHVLTAPGQVLLSNTGDGLKNYYTFAWHVEHDPGALHYGGSGHPYGEHVFFTDGHPLLSWVLQALPITGSVAIGVLHVLLLLGLLFCAWSLYALLREFGLPGWAAAVGGFSLMVLQPQLFRLGGHLSLAHAWVIPFTWLMLVRAQRDGRVWRWTLFGTLSGIVAYLTHPYLGLMTGALQAALLCLLLVTRWKTTWRDPRFHVRAVLVVGVPVLLFLLLLNMGDTPPDRPANPGGADEYATRFLSLIVPHHPPFSTELNDFFRYDALEWESWCYLGLSTILLLVVVGAVQVRTWVMGERPMPGSDLPGLSLAAGSLLLLFAMGILTDILGDLLPMLRQFRGTGRFAWVFWHTCTVFVTVRLYQYLYGRQHPPRPVVAASVFTFVVGFMAVEGWAYHERTASKFGHDTPNVFNPASLSGELAELLQAAQRANAVAIIPLPYPNSGSEHYQRDGRDGSLGLAYPIAFHSGSPLMAGVTSRTSHSWTRDLLAVLSPEEFPKALADRFAPDDTFLIVRSNHALDDDEQLLLDRCSPLVANGAGELRTISAATLFGNTASRQVDLYQRSSAAWPLCYGRRLSIGGDAAPDSMCLMVRGDVSEEEFISVAFDHTTVMEVPPNLLDSACEYELSFHFRPYDPSAINVSLILELFSPGMNDQEWTLLKNLRSMPMQQPGHTIATMRFRVDDPGKVHKFLLNGPKDNLGRYVVTHRLLRPVHLDVWREGTWLGSPMLFRNNVPLTISADRAATP